VACLKVGSAKGIYWHPHETNNLYWQFLHGCGAKHHTVTLQALYKCDPVSLLQWGYNLLKSKNSVFSQLSHISVLLRTSSVMLCYHVMANLEQWVWHTWPIRGIHRALSPKVRLKVAYMIDALHTTKELVFKN
jgi:hypothetical protein